MKECRLLTEFCKIRIGNFYELIAIENLDDICEEIIFKKLSKKIFELGLLDENNGYLFVDFESKSLDLAFFGLYNLKKFIKSDKNQEIYHQTTLLKILKSLEFKNIEDGYLIEFEDEKEEEDLEKFEEEMMTQNSLAKRASSSNLRLTRDYLTSKIRISNLIKN